MGLQVWPNLTENIAMNSGDPFGKDGAADLPDAATLAHLVSNVTRVSCGMTFTPADDAARGESICGRMVLMPFGGERDMFFEAPLARKRGARRVRPRA